MERKGGRGKCAVCHHDDQVRIDADLGSGASINQLSQRYGISRGALTAHRVNHLSPALAKVRAGRSAKGAMSLIQRIEDLIARTEVFLERAEQTNQVAQGLSAVRELRGLVELLGKATGELAERPAMTVNLLMSDEFIRARTAMVEALSPYPEAGLAVASRLNALNGH